MPKHFTVAARVLRHLGAELITSDEIALNELIKNSFDALSTSISIFISAPFDMATIRALVKELDPATAEEEGSGEPNLEKCKARAEGSILSEIGKVERERLAAKLAGIEDLAKLKGELERWLNDECWIQVDDDGSGMSDEQLANVFLRIGTAEKFKLKLGGAEAGRRPTLGDKGIGRLSMMRLGRYAIVESAAMKQTFHRVEFDWNDFDNPDLDLEDVEVEVQKGRRRQTPNEHGTTIFISGLLGDWSSEKAQGFVEYYLRRLRDPFAKRAPNFSIHLYFNGARQGIALIEEWFKECAKFKASFSYVPHLKEPERVWLTRSMRWMDKKTDDVREWSGNDLARFLSSSLRELAAIGPFETHCLWYNRQQLYDPTEQHDARQIRRELKIWAGGFSIYRDGFRVGWTGGEHDDWMRLDSRALQSKGYTFNRLQTVGSVAISSRRNPSLVDTSSREGLVDCKEFGLLRGILDTVAYQDLTAQISAVAEVDVKKVIEEKTAEDSIFRSEQRLQATLVSVNKLAQKVPQAVRSDVREIQANLREHGEDLKALRKGLQLAREKRIEILELAGMGMVVDVVLHELDRITQRTNDLLQQIEDGSVDPQFERLVESLREQLKAANRRIKAVDPLSPATRNRKTDFDLLDYVKSIVDGYQKRFERHGIQCQVLMDAQEKIKPIMVTMVKGLVAQVVENLLSNSVYWLDHGLAPGESQRQIVVDIDSKGSYLEITDNGPGIDPAYREEIFKPYFSLKKNGKGLGLYIARELANYHHGELNVDQNQGKDGRLRTFTLTLPKE